MLATLEIIRETSQLAQVEELLPRWREVPLYRDLFAQKNCRHADFDCFRQLPLMAKQEMRNNFPQNFLPAGQTIESLLEKNLIELEYTSGTSSERLPVIFGRGWWNAQEERALRLNDFVAKILDEFPNARRATITSPACNGLTCPTVWMSREQRTFGNALFVNLARIPFLIGDAELLHMAAEISDWSPQFLDVDPVHGARFALYCEQHGIKFPSLKFILCSYEFVSVVHRKILARVFGVPVFNLYGSTETGHLLMENERGEMKPSCDTAFLEIVNADARGVGELVVTTLTNDYMPLLRYRIGDLVEQHVEPYGNHFTVHGRARDALVASCDGAAHNDAGSGSMLCRSKWHRTLRIATKRKRRLCLAFRAGWSGSDERRIARCNFTTRSVAKIFRRNQNRGDAGFGSCGFWKIPADFPHSVNQITSSPHRRDARRRGRQAR